MNSRATNLVLFDIDGTLTAPRKVIKEDMLNVLSKLRKKVTIGVVGGSDFPKAKQQLGDTIVDDFDFVFTENGLHAFKNGLHIHTRSLRDHLGDEKITKFVNFVLRYIADLDIPKKRGTFVEFRNGMINVSPIGRNCSQEEREDFNEYDKEHKIRETMVAVLEKEFADYGLQYGIGGQISFDVYPRGWDKTYCLVHVRNDGFDTIHFFGDKCHPGGNDHELYSSEEVMGHSVTGPENTEELLTKMFDL